MYLRNWWLSSHEQKVSRLRYVLLSGVLIDMKGVLGEKKRDTYLKRVESGEDVEQLRVEIYDTYKEYAYKKGPSSIFNPEREIETLTRYLSFGKYDLNEVKEKLVWFVCYDANMSTGRLNMFYSGYPAPKLMLPRHGKYHFGDDLVIYDNLPTVIPYALYYSKENVKTKWNDNNLAFIDTGEIAPTLARMFLITEKQFKRICDQMGHEDDKYNLLINLGKFEGWDMFTVTNKKRLPPHNPNMYYKLCMESGLHKCGFSEETVNQYFDEVHKCFEILF